MIITKKDFIIYLWFWNIGPNRFIRLLCKQTNVSFSSDRNSSISIDSTRLKLRSNTLSSDKRLKTPGSRKAIWLVDKLRSCRLASSSKTSCSITAILLMSRWRCCKLWSDEKTRESRELILLSFKYSSRKLVRGWKMSWSRVPIELWLKWSCFRLVSPAKRPDARLVILLLLKLSSASELRLRLIVGVRARVARRDSVWKGSSENVWTLRFCLLNWVGVVSEMEMFLWMLVKYD